MIVAMATVGHHDTFDAEDARRINMQFVQLIIRSNYLRAVGRKVLWSSACVCVSVRTLLSARYISRTGSWITTKFGGWEQGVNL